MTIQSDLDMLSLHLDDTDFVGSELIKKIKLQVESLEEDAWKYRDLADDGK